MAGRIRRFNLGWVKLDARPVREQADVKRWISVATRKAVGFRPDALVMETLSRMRVPLQSVPRAGTSARRSDKEEGSGGSRIPLVAGRKLRTRGKSPVGFSIEGNGYDWLSAGFSKLRLQPCGEMMSKTAKSKTQAYRRVNEPSETG